MRPLNESLFSFRVADATPWLVSALLKLIALRILIVRMVVATWGSR